MPSDRLIRVYLHGARFACGLPSSLPPPTLLLNHAYLSFPSPFSQNGWLECAWLPSHRLVVRSLVFACDLISGAGANREVKKAVEAYWAGKISAEQLTQAAADVRKTSWQSVKGKGVDWVPRLAILLCVSDAVG
jgi:hypothetical protein